MVNLDESVSHCSELFKKEKNQNVCAIFKKPLHTPWIWNVCDLYDASKTGQQKMSNDCIIIESVPCQPEISKHINLFYIYEEFLHDFLLLWPLEQSPLTSCQTFQFSICKFFSIIIFNWQFLLSFYRSQSMPTISSLFPTFGSN